MVQLCRIVSTLLLFAFAKIFKQRNIFYSIVKDNIEGGAECD